MPKRKFAYRIRNGQMGGRSKIGFNSEPAAIVDLSDDNDFEDTVGANIFHLLPDDGSDDEEEKGCSDENIEVIIQEAQRIEKRWRAAENNTNLRGRGTSRSTYYALKKKSEKLLESGRSTQLIANFFGARQAEVSGEQSTSSGVPVPPLSTAEPVVVQDNDNDNETDDIK